MSKPLKLKLRLPGITIEARSCDDFGRADDDQPDLENLAWLFEDIITRLPYPRRHLLLAKIAVSLAENGEVEALDETTDQGFVDAAARLVEWWDVRDKELDEMTKAYVDRRNGSPGPGE